MIRSNKELECSPNSSTVARLGFLVCTFFATASLFAAPPEKTDKPVFFIQMTDPQLFGVFGGQRTVDKGLDDEETLFTRAIEHANRLKPDFVVITGDLIQNLGRKPEEVDAFERITKKLDSAIPLYLVSGNHDVTADPASLKWYRETFGEDLYAYDFGDRRFVVLDRQIMRSDDRTSGEAGRQLTWLKEQLAEARCLDKTIIIFTHQSIILKSDDEPTTYFSLPPQAPPTLPGPVPQTQRRRRLLRPLPPQRRSDPRRRRLRYHFGRLHAPGKRPAGDEAGSGTGWGGGA